MRVYFNPRDKQDGYVTKSEYDSWYKESKENEFNRSALATALFPNVRTESQFKEVLKLIPEKVPPDVNIVANINAASRMTLKQFYDAVRNKGVWDYKQLSRQYQEFGNWHFGIVAKAYGFPERIARMGAGAAQMLAGTSPRGFFSFETLMNDPNFGDDPFDQEMIELGFETYEKSILSWDRGQSDVRLIEPDADSDSEINFRFE